METETLFGLGVNGLKDKPTESDIKIEKEMENKKVLQKNGVNKIKPVVTPIDKKDTRNIMPEKFAEKKQKTQLKKSSALLAAFMERSTVDTIDAHSLKDVRSSSGLTNTGIIISYDESF